MKITATTFSQLLEVSEKSFYRWKNKDHIILVELINRYFNEMDIKEWLKDKKIKKFDYIDKYLNEINKKIERYLEYFSTNENGIIYLSRNKVPIVYIETMINLNKEDDFFNQLNNNIYLNKDIEEDEKRFFTNVLSKMIKNDIINIINDIANLLIATDLKILVEIALTKDDENIFNEAITQCTLFNVYKYKTSLSEQEKSNLFSEIIENNKMKSGIIKGAKQYFDYNNFENALEELKR